MVPSAVTVSRLLQSLNMESLIFVIDAGNVIETSELSFANKLPSRISIPSGSSIVFNFEAPENALGAVILFKLSGK